MTKELQSLQRQTIAQGMSLPQSTSFSGMATSFNALSNLGAFAAEKFSVGAAKQRGAADAFSNIGKPGRLAPGVTKATEAYNNAYNNVDITLTTLNGMKLLDDHLRSLSEPGKLNSNSVGVYDAFAKASIQGTLDGTTEQNKADVALRLGQHYFQNLARMGDRVSTFNNQEMEKDFTHIQNESLRMMQESRMAGDQEGVKSAVNSYNQLIQDKKSLGLLHPLEEQEMRQTLDNALVSVDYSARLLTARANGTEEQFLSELANKKPDGLSFEQWQTSISSVLKLKNRQDALVNEQQALSQAKWTQKLASGEIQSLEDLEGAKSELSALSYTNLQTSFIRSQVADGKLQRDIQDFANLNGVNPSAAERMPDSVKDAAYGQLLNAITQAKQFESNDPSASLSLIEKAEAAKQFRVPIRALNDELNYNIINGTPDQALEAALAYQRLAGRPDSLEDKSPVLDLPKTAEQIAVSVAMLANNTTDLLPDAVEKARKDILLVNDQEKAARLNNFEKTYSSGDKGTKNLKNAFSQVFGVSADANPERFESFKTVFRVNSGQMRSLDEALEYTKRSMTPVISTSKYAQNKETLMRFAPEKVVPFIENGHWFDNQRLLALSNIAKNYERHNELVKNLPANRERFNQLKSEIQELGKIDGRKIIPNTDGSFSTEVSITVTDPSINNGLPTNIPTIFNGKSVSPEKAIELIAKNGGVDPDSGRKLDAFNTIEEAETAAKARSNELGATLDERLKVLESKSLELDKLNKEIQVGSVKPARRVEWAYKNKVPEKLTERDLLEINIFRTSVDPSGILGRIGSAEKFKLRIDGTEREVFIDSDVSTRSRSNGKITYGLYYVDDLGITQNVPDAFNQYGVAEWAVEDFNNFLPNISRELNDKTINQVARKEAAAIFDRDSASAAFGIPLIMTPGKAVREIAKKKFVEGKSKEIAQDLKAKRDKAGNKP